MTMVYDDDWRPPWRHTKKARCNGRLCTPEGIPNRLVMACTLDKDGLCVNCARTVDDSHTWMRLGVENT